MISTTKLNEMITAELGTIELLRADVQAVLRICAVMVHPSWLHAMQDRLAERAGDFRAAVLAQGPFPNAAAARAVLDQEARYVRHALDDRVLM
jgi:hypothetical protein